MNRFIKVIKIILLKVSTALLTAFLISIIVFFVVSFTDRAGSVGIFATQEGIDATNAFRYSIIPLTILSFLTVKVKMPKIYKIYEIIALILIVIGFILWIPMFLYQFSFTK